MTAVGHGYRWTGARSSAFWCVACSMFALAPTLVACQAQSRAAELNEPRVALGQVWLTPAQVKDAKVETQPAAEQDVEHTIVTSGHVALDDLRSGHVFSPVNGRVVSVKAALGARVRRGDPLATIESPDIGTAVSDVHKAEADLIATEHAYQRKKDLFEQKASAEADVEAAEDDWRKAKAELERARQKTFLLRTGSVDAVTQSYTLVSPVDGEVLARNIGPGIEVQGQYSGGAAQELFTIGDLDQVWVLGDVYEVDLERVRVGSAATVTALDAEKRFAGRVDWVSGILDPATRTAKVRCVFDNPGKELRPEMYTSMQISVDPRRALAIPESALLRLGEYRAVFVEVSQKDGRLGFERVPVEVEERESSPWLEVRHGVDPGQKVVTRGGAMLSQLL
jgi:cobalt-zinc-cadmium efflux system membrane fusion protein